MEKSTQAPNETNWSRSGGLSPICNNNGSRDLLDGLGWYFIVEGYTELFYIQCLKNNTNTIKFNINKYGGNVKEGWEIRDGIICMCGNGFDVNVFTDLEKGMPDITGARRNVICVFDLDVCWDKKTILKKYKKILEDKVNKGYIFCTSMPSIEYWFLSHYEEMDDNHFYKTSGSVQKALKRIDNIRDLSNSKSNAFWNSDKGKEWVKFLCEDSNLNRAITRAKMKANKEERLDKVSNPKDCNISYSDMYKLFEIE